MADSNLIWIGVGAVHAIAGVWLLRGGRAQPQEKPRIPSRPTRTLIGVLLIVVGYHAAAWGCPDDWFPIKIPIRLWWVPAVMASFALAGSLWVDAREVRRSKVDG